MTGALLEISCFHHYSTVKVYLISYIYLPIYCMHVDFLNHTFLNNNNYIRKMVLGCENHSTMSRYKAHIPTIYLACDDYKVISGKSALPHIKHKRQCYYLLLSCSYAFRLQAFREIASKTSNSAINKSNAWL